MEFYILTKHLSFLQCQSWSDRLYCSSPNTWAGPCEYKYITTPRLFHPGSACVQASLSAWSGESEVVNSIKQPLLKMCKSVCCYDICAVQSVRDEKVESEMFSMRMWSLTQKAYLWLLELSNGVVRFLYKVFGSFNYTAAVLFFGLQSFRINLSKQPLRVHNQAQHTHTYSLRTILAATPRKVQILHHNFSPPSQ